MPKKPQLRNTGRPPSTTSRRAIAERLTTELGVKITARMIQGWQELGFDLDDTAKLRRELETLQRPPGEEAGEAAGGLRELILRAELRRKNASADRLELEAGKVRGELTPSAEVYSQGQALGFEFRKALEKLSHDLPPLLAGLPASDVFKILQREHRLVLKNLRDTSPERYLENLKSSQS